MFVCDVFVSLSLLLSLPFLPRRKGPGDGGKTPQTTAGGKK
jgi:hypothetical protein